MVFIFNITALSRFYTALNSPTELHTDFELFLTFSLPKPLSEGRPYENFWRGSEPLSSSASVAHRTLISPF